MTGAGSVMGRKEKAEAEAPILGHLM